MADEYADVLDRVGQQYPALAPHLQDFVVQGGTAPEGSGNHLEYYHPWEDENPNRGKATIEVYNKNLKGKELESAVAGDALHYLGAINPNTKGPIDPDYFLLKQKLAESITPRQDAMNRVAWEEEKRASPGAIQDYGSWLQNSRLDAYIRGYITPDQNDEWRKQGIYTKDQEAILEAMAAHLKRPAQ